MIALFGGDDRLMFLYRKLNETGIQAYHFKRLPVREESERISMAVLPLPRSADEMGRVPGMEGVSVMEMLAALPNAIPVVAGRLPPDLEAQCAKKNWRLLRPEKDERYVRRNAELTAEGAVYRLMRGSPFALRERTVMITGYGRIAARLHYLLRGLDARVVIGARRPEALAEAEQNGAYTVCLPLTAAEVERVDALVNTVPSPLIDKELLAAVPPRAILVELASPPYGFDMDGAAQLGRKIDLAAGLPGAYAPETAGEIIKEYVLAQLKGRDDT